MSVSFRFALSATDGDSQALVHRQYIVVRTSLLGSIVVNILLVLGLAILIGEGQERGQTYNVIATRVAAGLFCLTTVSMLVPVSQRVYLLGITLTLCL